jgi:hypothetical protein
MAGARRSAPAGAAADPEKSTGTNRNWGEGWSVEGDLKFPGPMGRAVPGQLNESGRGGQGQGVGFVWGLRLRCRCHLRWRLERVIQRERERE